jgi:uncharacterized RDD family membrane protein YckC
MNEQARNPYEPTKVPLFADGPPASAAVSEYEREYGGFWLRVGALLIDGVILLPATAMQFFGPQWSRMYFWYSIIPMLLLNAFYWIYLVKRFGGTPGKRILKMRITMEDGAPLTRLAALLRNAPLYLGSALTTFATALAARTISDSDFIALGYLDKLRLLNANAPWWNIWVSTSLQIFVLVTAIVMLCNYRRRALHDYIAGTVVLREGR